MGGGFGNPLLSKQTSQLGGFGPPRPSRPLLPRHLRQQLPRLSLTRQPLVSGRPATIRLVRPAADRPKPTRRELPDTVGSQRVAAPSPCPETQFEGAPPAPDRSRS